MLRSNWLRATAFSLAPLFALTGCGTGEYQKRMAERANSLETAGSFESNLRPEFAAVNADCKLRLPAIYDGDSKAFPNGASPSFCNLPGLTTTYEKFMSEGEKAFPFYTYFAASAVADQKPEEFKAKIEADLAKAGISGGKFAPESIPGPTGGAQTWDKLSITSMQNFAGKNPGQDIAIEGQFDLYFRSTGKDFILVGWRAPKTAAGASAFFENARRAMGTAQVTESAPPTTTPPTSGS